MLKGESATHRSSVFTAFMEVQRAITDGRWKLIVYPRINKTQLFDLQKDPHETNGFGRRMRIMRQRCGG